MNPLEQVRIEKAAADCGFELTATRNEKGALELRSVRFPEVVEVGVSGDGRYLVSFPAELKGLIGPPHTAEIDSVDELYKVLQQVAVTARNLPNRIADKFREKVSTMPTSTEAERLVVQRVGQNLFREALIDYWLGCCAVTGLAVVPLLRASHIKPWSKCDSDDERLDVFNGLLLAPHLDALFDGGWISFSATGDILISKQLAHVDRTKLGLTLDLRLNGLSHAHQGYLEFHRANELKQ